MWGNKNTVLLLFSIVSCSRNATPLTIMYCKLKEDKQLISATAEIFSFI